MFSAKPGLERPLRKMPAGRRGATLRLLVGIAIEAAGLALLLAMGCLSILDAPLGPGVVIGTVFGVSLVVLAAGGLFALIHRALPGTRSNGR